MRYVPFFLLLFVACGEVSTSDPNDRPGADNSVYPPSAPLEFKTNYLLRHSPDCDTLTEFCARVELRYPEFFGGTAVARTALNRQVRYWLVSELGYRGTIDAAMPTLESATDRYFEEFAQYRTDRELPDAWRFAASDGQILFETDSLLTLQLRTSLHTGQFPVERTHLGTFRRRDGYSVTLDQIYDDPFVPVDLARQGLERTRQDVLRSDGNLNIFQPDRLRPPLNYGVVGDSIVFHYFAGEIAPAAYGPTRFSIPRFQYANLVY